MFHMNPVPNPNLKIDWTDLFASTPRHFTDDFCHLDGITYGVVAQSEKGAQFAFSESLFFRDLWMIQDRIRVRLPLFRNKIVEGYFTNERVGVTFNHGLSMIWGKPFFFYGGTGANRDGSHPYIKLGVLSNHTKCHSDNRVILESDLILTWYHKTILNLNAFRLGLLGVYNFTEAKLEKADFFAGYTKDKFNVYFKAFQPWRQPRKHLLGKQFFKTLTLNATYARNQNQTYGAEVILSPAKSQLNEASLLVDYYRSRNDRIKAKINTFSAVTLLLQKKFNEQVSLSLGISFPIVKFEGHRRTRTGMRLFFNV